MKRVIKVRNISKTINKKKILDNINFDIYEGEIVGLVGKNGAGKSTLLKIMTGLYSYDEGEIYYYNYNLKTDYEKAMSIVGTLIENPDMYSNLTGKKNLELFKSMFKGIDEGTVEEIVRIVEMEKYLGKKFKTYSLGMKERLGIASSLINKPKILILDEPTNGLDREGIKKIMKMLKELKDTTIIISSHMLNDIEELCNKIIFINDGKIDSIKIKQNDNKKNVFFEVDDFSKARLIIKDYCINENLEVYESDDTISLINKELVLNDINVYRISETTNNLEKDFFKMIGKYNDKTN
ncbi:MAG: ABC transporter ATP-binding protein [Bacilli bacterium]|nr:ABC transporter ATP-binding protein [Mollicutes bacterium]